MGKRIDDDSPAADLHELRKVGKELRYLLEFFGGIFDPETVKPMLKALKALQDVLGRFQDTLASLGVCRTPCRNGYHRHAQTHENERSFS